MTKNIREIEDQQIRINELINLTQQNPELKIIPMVDGDLGGYEHSYYLGYWGNAKIDEVYYGDEVIYFKSSDEEELVEKQADNIYVDEYPSNKKSTDKEHELVTKKAVDYVNKLPWEKVIVVQINLPY